MVYTELHDIQYEKIVEGHEIAYVISFLFTSHQENYFTRIIRKANLIDWMTKDEKYSDLPKDKESDEEGNYFTGTAAYEMHLETYFDQVVSDWILSTCQTPELTKELMR